MVNKYFYTDAIVSSPVFMYMHIFLTQNISFFLKVAYTLLSVTVYVHGCNYESPSTSVQFKNLRPYF